MAFSRQDIECMALALKLSKKGRASVGANPMVGCVITRDDKIIAQDYHRQYGKVTLKLMLWIKLNSKVRVLNYT